MTLRTHTPPFPYTTLFRSRGSRVCKTTRGRNGKMSDTDKAKNKAEEMKGKAKEAAGKTVGNERLEAEGKADQAAGNVKQADRKSTRLNSSHPSISYAVFCL